MQCSVGNENDSSLSLNTISLRKKARTILYSPKKENKPFYLNVNTTLKMISNKYLVAMTLYTSILFQYLICLQMPINAQVSK